MAAAAPTSPIHICNLALHRIGQASVVSIDEPTTGPEDVLAIHYVPTRQEVLRRFIFNFSKKYAVLTADAVKVPAFGYATAYNLPNDFLRLLALGDVAVNGDSPSSYFDLSEGFIFTDSNQAEDGGLNIEYIFDATTVAKYDPLFTRLFALTLARNIAYKFTLKPSLVKDLYQELGDLSLAAAAIAGQEKPPRRIERSRFRDVRRGWGNFRDNSRV